MNSRDYTKKIFLRVNWLTFRSIEQVVLMEDIAWVETQNYWPLGVRPNRHQMEGFVLPELEHVIRFSLVKSTAVSNIATDF